MEKKKRRKKGPTHVQEKKRKKIGKEKENDGKKLRLSITYLFSFSTIIEIKHGIHIHNQVQFMVILMFGKS